MGNRMKHGTHMPQEDWSNFAQETGPDTRQPEMVSREKVLRIIGEHQMVLSDSDMVDRSIKTVLASVATKVLQL